MSRPWKGILGKGVSDSETCMDYFVLTGRSSENLNCLKWHTDFCPVLCHTIGQLTS